MSELALSILRPDVVAQIGKAVSLVAKPVESSMDFDLHAALAALQFPEVTDYGYPPFAPFNVVFVDVQDLNDQFLDPAIAILLRGEVLRSIVFSAEKKHRMAVGCQNGLALLRERFPDTMSACASFMRTIAIANCASSKGGSSSDAIGLMWLSPEPHWSVTEFAESILHECVHSALFLTHMVHGVFSRSVREMDTPTEYVCSAIRRTRRRYDLSFHSAAVGYVLSCFEERLGNTTAATRYLGPLFRCILELGEKRHNLTPFGRYLLAELSELTAELARRVRGVN